MEKVVHSRKGLQITSWLLSGLMMMPMLASCGGGQDNAAVPPTSNNRVASNAAPGSTPKKQGLTTGQKVAVTLAGAAALYYLYNQRKKSQEKTGPNSQYYLSKNGRVYYRDAQGKAVWVSPPQGGIQVPAEQAERYRDFQGYNNRQTGRDLTTVPEARTSTY